MKEYVKQHYVPLFYLENFSSSNSDKTIYCYDKVRDKSFKTNIRDIGHENLFYGITGAETEIEKALGRVETRFLSGSYNDLIKLKNYNKLSRVDKGWFCLFLAFQLFRTKETRLMIKEMREKLVLEEAKKEMEEQNGIKLPDWLTIKFTDPEYIKALHLDLMYRDLKPFFDIGNYFGFKTWYILLNKTGTPLWTSDNPLSFYNEYGGEGNLGIMCPGVEIRFPLSKELQLLTIDQQTHIPLKNRDKMTLSMVKQANELQAKSSTRFVYSSEDDFSLAKNFLLWHPKFKNPNRSRFRFLRNGNNIESIRLE